MDMDAFGDDFKVPQRIIRKAYEIDHESLSQSAVEKLMANDIEHISGIFGVDVRTYHCFQCLLTAALVAIILIDKHGSTSVAAHGLEQRTAH